MFSKISRKKIILVSVVVIFLIGLVLVLAGIVNAQTQTSPTNTVLEGVNVIEQPLGLPKTDIRLIVAKIIRVALGLLGILAIAIMLYGGYVWMTAGGNEEKIGTARKILINGAIGLVIILSAYAITTFVINSLLEATLGIPGHCTNGIQDQGETGKDCGGACPPCQTIILPGSDSLYIVSMFKAKKVCIRNVHPSISFNRPVDIKTIDNLTIRMVDNKKQVVKGKWKYSDSSSTTVEFVAYGDCGDGGIWDCFAKSSTYTLQFIKKNTKDIKSYNGKYSLNCSGGFRGVPCQNVTFVTGNNVDRIAPEILDFKIKDVSPFSIGQFYVGDMLEASVKYKDDNGLQRINIYADDYYLVTSTDFSSCIPSGTVKLRWSTVGWPATKYKIDGYVFDWTMAKDSTTTDINLLAQCKKDEDCAQGICINGKCVSKTMITSISPEPTIGGAVGTYVSISGYHFGSTTGKVYVKNKSGVTTTAKLANCGAGAWTDQQIIIQISSSTASSTPFTVETDPSILDTNRIKYDQDSTNDSYGPVIDNFVVNNIQRPGLCKADPDFGPIYSKVKLKGINFGIVPNEVYFGDNKAPIGYWTDKEVTTNVPGLLGKGSVAVTVKHKSGYPSNGVKFDVTAGIDPSAPYIKSIEPTRGARGEYIVINGSNFGTKPGKVWFRKNATGAAFDGDPNFPAACLTKVWTDQKIIIKFPKVKKSSIPEKTNYSVQVKPINYAQASPMYRYFYLEADTTQPKPGICSISPASSPDPLPTGVTVDIVGEYFGSNYSVYFSKDGSSSTTPKNGLKVVANQLTSSQNPGDGSYTASVKQLPQAGGQGPKTGPVIVYRDTDKKQSNNILFSVKSCLSNGKPDDKQCTNSSASKCCSNGTCVASNLLCYGQTRWSAYIWRFSTKDIPKRPRVTEWCEFGSAARIPSPTPNIRYKDTGKVKKADDQYNVCRTALISIDFNREINKINIKKGDSAAQLIVSECKDAGYDDPSLCPNYTSITVKDVKTGSTNVATPRLSSKVGISTTTYIQLKSNYTGAEWKDGYWYRVVLKGKKSGVSAGSGSDQVFLSPDRPCSEVKDSAYCFWFKTDSTDCKLSKIIVIPYSWWTSVLESPIKVSSGRDLLYGGHGLSTQNCIMMDMDKYDWKWSTSNGKYSKIVGVDNEREDIKASALANTVGVGLTNNEVDIKTVASTGTPPNVITYPGKSPLTIDLSNPQVVEYWPNCWEACPDAEVGVRFNTSMSKRNLVNAAQNRSVQLLKCIDENCFNTKSVANSSDIFLVKDSYPNYTVLKIANSNLNSQALEPNTIYKVIISASTTNFSSKQLVWSLNNITNPNNSNNYSKPLTKEFSWRFRTKKDKCKIDRVEVLPSKYYARSIVDRGIFKVQPYSAPDSCNAKGQKLNPWKVSWKWDSTKKQVATVFSTSTQGYNQYCTIDCLKKGSYVPANSNIVPICGNNVQEAGEDCDTPDFTKGCGLNCLLMGNPNATTTTGTDVGLCGDGFISKDKGEECDPGIPTSTVGCSKICLHTGSRQKTAATSVSASVCGNGYIGSGEDCDLGISASSTNPKSATGCSQDCRHIGTVLSSYWCEVNSSTHAGFTTSTFEQACKSAYSICGDGVTGPEEDTGCDLGKGKVNKKCDNNCLWNSSSKQECTPNSAGCDSNGQHKGSSLLYSNPSVCGDGVVGLGEDKSCETNLIGDHKGLINPWALGIGVGQDTVTVNLPPPSQISNITSKTSQNTSGGAVKGAGQFIIPCGYKNDDDCKIMADPSKGIMPDDLGVGSNSCCYLRPKLLSVYPGVSTSLAGTIVTNTCPNTAIEATFNKKIDSTSLAGNLVIARGIGKQLLSTPAVIKPEVNMSDHPTSVYVQGKFAYVGAGGSFKVVDIGVPKKAKILGTLSVSKVTSVYKNSSKYAYLVANKKFYTVDVTSSSKPKIMGTTSTVGIDYDNLVVRGQYAYVTAGSSGLRIISINSSTYPFEVASVTPKVGVQYFDLAISGKYAYVTAGTKGLRLVKISNPNSPLEATSTIKTGISYGAIDLGSSAKYAYVTAGSKGLRVFDISNPRSIKEISNFVHTTSQSVNYIDVAVKNNYAYVLDKNKGLIIIDISDPTKPVLAEKNPISLIGLGAAVFLGNFHAYVATDKNLSIVDIGKYTLGCNGKSDVTSLITSALEVNKSQQPWYKKLWFKIANFFKKLFGGKVTAASNQPIKWCAGLDPGGAQVLTFTGTTTSRVSITLSRPLATSTHYAIVLKENIRDTQGVALGYKNIKTKKNWYWRFETGSKICEVNKVGITPKEVYFSKYGATSTLLAEAYTGSAATNYKKIQPIKNWYYWQYNWNPFNIYVKIASTTTVYPNPNVITAKNQNGEIDIRASAEIIDNKYTNKFGLQGEIGSSHAIVYLCSNPWPPKDLYIYKNGKKNGPYIIFPFADTYDNNDHFDLASNTFDNKPMVASPFGGYFNFKTYYCADAGTISKSDDLPYLKPALQVTSNIGSTIILSATGTLKRFLFTNDKNTDVIGIQVFANPNHLSAKEWYQNVRKFSGNIQATKLDSYDAIQDSNGDNVYVAALNWQDKGSSSKHLFSNIYLFSVNSDATSQTKKVFKQLKENLQFNTNLTNYGYCGQGVKMGIGSTTCKNDFDCTKTGEFCSQQIDKLKRNFQRLKDLAQIQAALKGKTSTTTPNLAEGSLLKGQTVSTWNSWTSVLGSALKISLPTDRVNKLGKAGTCKEDAEEYCLDDSNCKNNVGPTSTCLYHDSTTGWSTAKIPGTVDRRLSFACATSSLAYRYFYSTSTNYLIRGRFEDPFGNNAQYSLGKVGVAGAQIKNWYSDFVSKFVSSSHFILDSDTGICKQDEEIVSLNQGVVCGDKVVNITKEQCDPPGQTSYTLADITKQCTSKTASFKYNVCGSNCQWTQTSTPCAQFQSCGNGILEGDEKCDFGALNGSYNIKCDTNCQQNYSNGYCGDGQVNLPYEFCDPSNSSFDLYNLKQKKSCSSDCKSYGFYCGDSQIQKGYGETCEGNSTQSCTTTVNNVVLPGTQSCDTTNCKWKSCTTTAKTLSTKIPDCGDGYLDTKTEACDEGHPLKGGKNGQVCSPKYGEECSYCDGNCQVVIVGKKEWCGDGKIQGPEICETDEFGNIYAATTSTLNAGEVMTSSFTAWLANIKVKKPEYVTSITTSSSGYVSSTFAQGYLLKKCTEESSPVSTYRKGTKTCPSNKCDKVVNSCVNCGIDIINGTGVTGGIINVLDPKSTNPLWGGNYNSTTQYMLGIFFPGGAVGQDGTMDLRMNNERMACSQWPKKSSSTYKLFDPSGGCLTKNKVALLNYNPICSATPTPYMMTINASANNAFKFPVYSSAAYNLQPWMYDLILSPVIPTDAPVISEIVKGKKKDRTNKNLARPNEFRIVVSWNKNSEFYSGFLVDNIVPKIDQSATSGKLDFGRYDIKTLLEIYRELDTTHPYIGGISGNESDLYYALDNSYNSSTKTFAPDSNDKHTIEKFLPRYSSSSKINIVEGSSLRITSSTGYYSYDPQVKISRPDYGIWYHGFGYTKSNRTNVQAFTVNLARLSGNEHAFYVRLVPKAKNVKSISDKKTFNLKVKVYLPQQISSGEWYYYRTFDPNPAYEFNLNAAEPSANPTALYWHVFNFRRTATATSSTIVKIGGRNNGKIITNMTQIKYNQYGL